MLTAHDGVTMQHIVSQALLAYVAKSEIAQWTTPLPLVAPEAHPTTKPKHASTTTHATKHTTRKTVPKVAETHT